VTGPETQPPAPAEAAPDDVPRPDPCPRCGAPLEPDQEWCLSCGTAARTTIAAPPAWRVPLAVLAVVALLCGAALAWAFVELTNNDDDVRAATTAPVTTTTAPPPTTAGAPPATDPGQQTPVDPAQQAPVDPAQQAPPAADPAQPAG